MASFFTISSRPDDFRCFLRQYCRASWAKTKADGHLLSVRDGGSGGLGTRMRQHHFLHLL